jgi:hypothetical protein
VPDVNAQRLHVDASARQSQPTGLDVHSIRDRRVNAFDLGAAFVFLPRPVYAAVQHRQ